MKYIIPSLAVMALVPFLLFSSVAALEMPRALGIIENVVLTTLFPASVLSRLVAFSFIGECIAKFLSKTFMWKAVGLQEKYIPAVVAGLICGFPAGAIILRDIKGENREKALALSSVPSLAFLCRVLGTQKGIVLFTAFVGVLFVFSHFIPTKKENSDTSCFEKMNFVRALSSGIESAVAMSGAIIFFVTLLSFVPESSPTLIKEICYAVCEIGAGASISSHPLTLALSLSFGGLSVLSQISFMSGGVRLRYYLISRIFLFFVAVLILCK
jgi:hypothetical protein